MQKPPSSSPPYLTGNARSVRLHRKLACEVRSARKLLTRDIENVSSPTLHYNSPLAMISDARVLTKYLYWTFSREVGNESMRCVERAKSLRIRNRCERFQGFRQPEARPLRSRKYVTQEGPIAVQNPPARLAFPPRNLSNWTLFQHRWAGAQAHLRGEPRANLSRLRTSATLGNRREN